MHSNCSGLKFRKMVEHEMARSERNGLVCSIIVFNLDHQGNDKTGRQAIACLIRKRIRSYDDMEWIGENLIGVLLPSAPFAPALRLAEEISRTTVGAALNTRYVVRSYPKHLDATMLDAVQHNNGCTERPEKNSRDPLHASLENFVNRLHVPRNHMPFWKRVTDIIGAVFGLIVLAPVFAALGIFIKIVSPGPVLYNQQRVGFLGKTFKCYKFRTMHAGAEDAVHNRYFSRLMSIETPMEKLDEEDNRIIMCGRMLRKTGLDELPQLWNVLKGDMSLIGPRPCIPYEARQYKRWQCKRFEAVPGITGLWQVNGKNKTTFNEMMRYDISYALQKNFLLDMHILLKTIPAVVSQVVDGRLTKDQAVFVESRQVPPREFEGYP